MRQSTIRCKNIGCLCGKAVLIYSDVEFYGGGERYLLDVAHMLDREYVIVLAECGSAFSPGGVASSGQYIKWNVGDYKGRALPHMVVALRLAWAAFRAKPCVIVGNACVALALAGILSRRPVIAVCHMETTESVRKRWLKRVMYKTFARTGVVYERLGLAVRMEYQVSPARVFVAPAPGRSAGDPAKVERQSANVVVACVARLDVEQKCQDILLQAWGSVEARCAGARLELVGAGADRVLLESLVQRLHLQHVKFRGFVQDVDAVWRGVDIAVLASAREGVPYSLIEAAERGIPCVATDVGGVADVVLDGVNGLVVRPGDSRELADAIVRLISDDRERSQMGSAGIGVVLSQRAWDKVSRVWLAEVRGFAR